MQMCFAGICAGWAAKQRKHVSNTFSGDEQGKILFGGRLTLGSEKVQAAMHATNAGGLRPGVEERKLIFLDIDGPLAPWRNGKEHRWSAGDSFGNRAYCKNVDALMRIINSAGGTGVVKVIISSNWRTDPDKYQWLIDQMGKRGIDVIGHTDIMRAHPPPQNHSHFSRILEIRRVLEQRIVGAKGPYVTEDGTNAFEAVSLPENWKITAWIAIDDLDLGGSRYDGLQNIKYLSRFMHVVSDPDAGRGWMNPEDNFVDEVQAWLKAFESSHFVRVGATDGIAGTRRAEERAAKLLRTD